MSVPYTMRARCLGQPRKQYVRVVVLVAVKAHSVKWGCLDSEGAIRMHFSGTNATTTKTRLLVEGLTTRSVPSIPPRYVRVRRFPDLDPGSQSSEGNHYVALYPYDDVPEKNKEAL